MSFLDRAKQAAASVADQAKQTAEQARHTAVESVDKAQAAIHDPATADKAKAALSRAKRGIATAIDRIDPAVLADVIIKATALQERANIALKTKGSPYRISQIEIGAAIPPSVTFSINRVDAYEEILTDSVASTELAERLRPETATDIRALDGSLIDAGSLEADGEG